MIGLLGTLFAQLQFSRTLAAVLLANLSSLVLMNSLGLAPSRLLLVYPAALGLFWWLLAKAHVRRPRFQASASMIGVCCAAFFLLTVPRAPYLLEWLPDNPVLAQADDFGHLAELVAMTLSPQYPLRHPSNQDFLLSHYYTAFFPMALLKAAVPMLTLKDCLFLGNALYHLLILGSLVELSTRWLPSRRAALIFLFLCTLFGGFDWLMYPRRLFGHGEFWTRDLVHAFRQVSSYYTGLYWVIHHFVGFYGVVLSVALAGQVRFESRWLKTALLGLLLIAAFFTSPFAFLPAVLLGAPELLHLLRRTWRTRVFPLLFVVFLAPLFLFTNRVQTETFHAAFLHPGWLPWPVWDGIASTVAYVLLVCVIDLAAIPLLLLARWRRFRAVERRYLLVSVAFLGSTAVVESIGFNNYCMRGMFLPCFVFFLLAAKVAANWRPQRAVLAGFVALTVMSTIKECAFLTYQPLMFSSFYWRVRGLTPPPQAQRLLRAAYPRLARNPEIRHYTPDAGDRLGLDKFNAEKFISGLPVEQMDKAEFELLRYPRRNLFW